MNREERYVVFKVADIEKYLNAEHKNVIESLKILINSNRHVDGKKSQLKCVVVEEDWPEYEKVWNMIETREEQQ